MPKFLSCAHYAKLDDLLVVFEMKTPISQKAVDVVLVGKSRKGENRVLLVELKQWSRIFSKYDSDKVYVPEAGATRKHPIKQLLIYQNNIFNHHSGIISARNSGADIRVGFIAYLHNFLDKSILCSDKYVKWKEFEQRIFYNDESEQKRLIRILNQWFDNSYHTDLLEILEDYDAVMGDAGLEGLRKAYANEASMIMKNDQQAIVDFVISRLQHQLTEPKKEIIVISGGPGTGKTIAGIRFILEYVRLFNNGKNDNKVIFCLPKSQTVKAVFDSACGVDEENENEYCCYLQDISKSQNLVVVDEAHRITDLEKTLDNVFQKGTNLIILLQDDHQLLRPGEQGTFAAFESYARNNGIVFSPKDITEKNLLTLKDEKRCNEYLYQGITKLFYDENMVIDRTVKCVEVFDDLRSLVKWKNDNSITENTKYIFPYCWDWPSRDSNDINKLQDIEISYSDLSGSFIRNWNPKDTDEQVVWLNDNKDDRVACIYTSQGLDMDNVALVWWDDLVWNEKNKSWEGNPVKLKDPAFKCRKNWKSGMWEQTIRKNDFKGGYRLSQTEMDNLIKNTYYVILSRPRKKLGIWFKDASTKKRVLEVLGIKSK